MDDRAAAGPPDRRCAGGAARPAAPPSPRRRRRRRRTAIASAAATGRRARADGQRRPPSAPTTASASATIDERATDRPGRPRERRRTPPCRRRRPRPRAPGGAGHPQPRRSMGQRSSTSSPSTSHATSCIAIVGSTWAGTTRTRSPTVGALVARGERDVLVAAEPDAGAVDRRVAVVHAERLQPDVGDGVAGPHGDDRADDEQRLLERQAELGVGRVHQRVAAGLHLGDAGRRRGCRRCRCRRPR